MSSNSGGATRVIGITGGIGSGKSAVTDELVRRGFYVLDADVISREAAAAGGPALAELRAEFGSEIVGADGALDRRAMSDIVFASREKMNIFNRVMRAAIGTIVGERIERFYANGGSGPLFLSAALLYEADWDGMCDEVWLVTADEAVRASRAAKRDGVTEEKIRERMAFQMPEAQKRKRADIIIENNGTPGELTERVGQLPLSR
ncbi:MAG: dephospho-CoA kinase [Clostridiales Family XIII bacterium]|nr:dephospho-CoA kinase [Clostridiales Family XIII bacterium]